MHVVSGLDADVIAIKSFAIRAAQPMYCWYRKRDDHKRSDEHQQDAVEVRARNGGGVTAFSSVLSHTITERAHARVIHLTFEPSLTSRL
jgi:hypothetical protein